MAKRGRRLGQPGAREDTHVSFVAGLVFNLPSTGQSYLVLSAEHMEHTGMRARRHNRASATLYRIYLKPCKVYGQRVKKAIVPFRHITGSAQNNVHTNEFQERPVSRAR